tara:strand:+ start:106 stop:492 length:387 start_codon:yes stop_codon:yes gene_type:complete
MSHYAKVINGVVDKVIVAEASFFETFVDDSPGKWIKTSYNTRGGIHYQPNTNQPSEDQSQALRKNFAGEGFTYDAELDAFIPYKVFESWVLNETTCLWEPPIPHPDDGNVYEWDEENIAWNQVTATGS